MGPLGSFIQLDAGSRWYWGRSGSEASFCRRAFCDASVACDCSSGTSEPIAATPESHRKALREVVIELGRESYPGCLALRSTDDSQAIAIASAPDSLLQPGAEPSQASTFQLHFQFAGDELFFVGYSLTEAKGAIRVFSRSIHYRLEGKKKSALSLPALGRLIKCTGIGAVWT